MLEALHLPGQQERRLTISSSESIYDMFYHLPPSHEDDIYGDVAVVFERRSKDRNPMQPIFSDLLLCEPTPGESQDKQTKWVRKIQVELIPLLLDVERKDISNDNLDIHTLVQKQFGKYRDVTNTSREQLEECIEEAAFLIQGNMHLTKDDPSNLNPVFIALHQADFQAGNYKNYYCGIRLPSYHADQPSDRFGELGRNFILINRTFIDFCIADLRFRIPIRPIKDASSLPVISEPRSTRSPELKWIDLRPDGGALYAQVEDPLRPFQPLRFVDITEVADISIPGQELEPNASLIHRLASKRSSRTQVLMEIQEFPGTKETSKKMPHPMHSMRLVPVTS